MPAPRATSSACSSSGSPISREWKGSLCSMAQGEDVGEMEAAITSRKRGREGFLSVSPPTSPYFFPSPRKPAKWAESGGGRQPMRGEGSREGERASFFLSLSHSFPPSSASWDPKVARLPTVITAEEPPPPRCRRSSSRSSGPSPPSTLLSLSLSFPPVAAPRKKGAFRKLAC